MRIAFALLISICYTFAAFSQELRTKDIKEQKEQEIQIERPKEIKPVVVVQEKKENHSGERKLRQKIRIYFAHDSARASAKEIKKLSQIKEIKNAVIMVAGYSDSHGTYKYNLRLSKRRAQTIYYRLKKRFRNLDVRMTYFGESKTQYLNSTRAGRAKNRTTEIKVFY